MLLDPNPWTETRSLLELRRSGVRRGGTFLCRFLGEPFGPTMSSKVLDPSDGMPFIGVVGRPDGVEELEPAPGGKTGIDIRTWLRSTLPAGDDDRESSGNEYWEFRRESISPCIVGQEDPLC